MKQMYTSSLQCLYPKLVVAHTIIKTIKLLFLYYVKVQFYPWFKFYSVCFKVIITHVHYLEEIWFIITKDLIEPCEVFIPGGLA